MFTGIVEEVGRIITADRKGNSARLKKEAEKVLEDIKIGYSIAVNGICLTVTSFGKNYFTADVMHETLRRSSIGEAAAGSPVNLERAMAAMKMCKKDVLFRECPMNHFCVSWKGKKRFQ